MHGWGQPIIPDRTLLFVRGAEKVPLRLNREAATEALAALRKLLPYAVVALAIVLLYRFGLSTIVNEHTAPNILPVVMLGMVGYADKH